MSQPNSAYLAYPIDQIEGEPPGFYDAINAFKVELSRVVSWVFDPGDAFLVNSRKSIDPGLALINRAALNNADVVVAFLPAGVPSVGVPMEIDRARAQGKIVVVFSDAPSFMLEMPGILRLGGWSDDDLAEAFAWILTQEPYDPGFPGYFGEIRWTGEPGMEPRRGYPDDAGFDLIVSEDVGIPPGEFRDVPCGISVELPERTWALITGRSSTLRKRSLLVSNGIIDTGYRGPLFAGVQNLDTEDTHWVNKGDRIAQLILFSNTTMRYTTQRVDLLGPSERGENGFGSTGA